MRIPTIVGVVSAFCSCAVNPLPPHGEVIIHVETDLPAPRIAGRLRIDLYDGSGTWFESRDLARPNPDDWPVSFSVYTDETEPKQVWVRLRAYPEGKVREYRGERFLDWPQVLTSAPGGSDNPRLIQDGIDRTPLREPEPLLTVDRLVLINLPLEAKQHAIVTLRGECVGTMSRLAASSDQGPTLKEASSCTHLARSRQIVEPEVLSPSPPTGTSLTGSWFAEPCTGSAKAGSVCVHGGVMVLGNRTLLFGDFTDAAPERVVAVSPFDMDVYEVTVGRYRQALHQGFSPSLSPRINDGSLSPTGDGACTFTSDVADREDYALNCVPWATAREYCMFLGGDLPTEVQWEYAVTQAGKERKSPFPWGDEEPLCESVVFGRMELAGKPGHCASTGLGPVPPGVGDALDISPAGVRGLGGGMAEWCRDGAAGFEDACWDTGVVDPWCGEDRKERSVRGGSWVSPLPVLVGTFRMARSKDLYANFLGFRCVYGGKP